jgi:hypothetical protein
MKQHEYPFQVIMNTADVYSWLLYELKNQYQMADIEEMIQQCIILLSGSFITTVCIFNLDLTRLRKQNLINNGFLTNEGVALSNLFNNLCFSIRQKLIDIGLDQLLDDETGELLYIYQRMHQGNIILCHHNAKVRKHV